MCAQIISNLQKWAFGLVHSIKYILAAKEKEVQREREKENEHYNAKQSSSSTSHSRSRSPVEPRK